MGEEMLIERVAIKTSEGIMPEFKPVYERFVGKYPDLRIIRISYSVTCGGRLDAYLQVDTHDGVAHLLRVEKDDGGQFYIHESIGQKGQVEFDML